MIELNSIAKGVETADAMMKTGSVRLIQCRPVCPGKYIIVIAGDVGAVKASMEAGCLHGDAFVVDTLLIPNLSDQVIQGILAAEMPAKQRAVGIAEYFSIASAITGADAAVKSADVRLVEIRLGIGIGGKSFVSMAGEVNAVEIGIAAACKKASESGMLLAQTVIPAINGDVWECLL